VAPGLERDGERGEERRREEKTITRQLGGLDTLAEERKKEDGTGGCGLLI